MQMIDKWLIVGVSHFAATALVLKLLGFVLPPCVTCCYNSTSGFLLYLVVAKFTFELTRSWHLTEKVPPENKAVFITDCESTLGQRLAKHLDSRGFHVFAGLRNIDGTAARTLRRESLQRIQLVHIDVSSDSSVEKAAKDVESRLGTSEFWALVNNAEIQKGFEVELTSIDEFRETMEVNGFGPVRVTKRVLPLLRQSRGRVINVTNPAGHVALPYITPYTMSKFAMTAFNDCLKQEMDVWGVRVISVEPHFFRDGLANSEQVQKKLEDTLSTLEQRVRDDYGTKYFKNFKTFAEVVCNSTRRFNDTVVQVIENTISLEHPNSNYKVSRNALFYVLNYFLERGPSSLTHLIMKVILFVHGLPKPQESENYS